VTVTDGGGQRYSLDVQADSSYDAAHLYLTHVPTTSTVFEVAVDGRILPVSGERLKKWIEKRRSEWTGPRGFLFSKRPMIGS
jgi:hypothetical protein